MPRRSARAGFSLVELLLALLLTGVAGACLAGALSGDRRLRAAAMAQAFAADRTRERLEQLAALPCGPELSGTSASPWASERWRATSSPVTWFLADSIVTVGSTASMVFAARVPCPD